MPNSKLETRNSKPASRRPRRLPLEDIVQNVAVHERERALRNLAAISGRVTSGVMAVLPSLLAESPDPDTALNGLERFVSAATPQMLRLLDRHPQLIHYVLVTFGYSPYLGDTLVQNPDVLAAFAKSAALDRALSAEDYRLALGSYRKAETDGPSLQMARFRRRQYVRIMLRDVLGIATLADTTAELSALADALIGEALQVAQDELRSRHGECEKAVAVVALGKLGGNELNYSSDIDLLFLYSGDPAEACGNLTSREHFVRLAQRTTELLAQVTAEGPVYRVDLRLRPRGAEGEPAISFDHALRYYGAEAHDWELQAMIKARHSAGDDALTSAFLAAVQPFVYRGALNFAAIETALVARRRISKRRAGGLGAQAWRRGLDVKVGRGGIRDIEFLAQCLQRVYGGGESWLRSRGTLFALQKLHDKGHIAGRDYYELSSAYVFLRNVEHRLQLRHGQQTHRVPASLESAAVLGRSLGGLLGQEDPERLPEIVEQRMAAIAAIYQRIVHQQERQEQTAEPPPQFQLTPTHEAGAALSFQQVVQRLAADSPQVYDIVARAELNSHGRHNLFRFFASAMNTAPIYREVLQHPRGVQRALQLLQISDLVSDILVRHPEEVAALEDFADDSSERLFPGVTAAKKNVQGQAGGVSQDYLLAQLRRSYRHRVFLNAASDVLQAHPVYDSLAENTASADEAIAAAHAIMRAPQELAVMALGRLGTRAFDHGSDADLIFVRDVSLPVEEAASAAAAIVHALAAYTNEGAVFSIDTRLRPRGGEGELVITPEQLQAYFAREAQPWEALSYTKLRHVAGSAGVAGSAQQAARAALPRFAADPGLIRELRAMRLRLEETTRELSFKISPGSIYDIDFIVSMLLVTNGMNGERGDLRESLNELASRGVLRSEHHEVLDRGAEVLRTLDHATRIVTGRPRKWLPAAERASEVVYQVAAQMLRCGPAALRIQLPELMHAVRSIFDELLPAQS